MAEPNQITGDMILTLFTFTLIFTMAAAASHQIPISIHKCPAKCTCVLPHQIVCNNGHLTHVPVHGFPPQTESLSLSKNNIPAIKTDAFVSFKFLRQLSLDGNNISHMEPFSFRGLPKLRELSIQNTMLSRLQKFSLSSLQNLTAILLAHNRITTIEESTFAGSSNIRLILLHHNPLITIEARAFSNLRNVEHLIFPSGIKFIEPNAFNGLDSVGLIKLPFMDLSALESFTFQGLTHVHVLAIQESDLGIVRPNAFSGLVNVGSLNIINNKIDHLQELKITFDNRIKIFRIVGNHLLQTPTIEAVDVHVLENFTVVANHFPCDCRILAILAGSMANATSYNFTLKNFCISPLQLHGKPISEMGFDRLANCADEYNLQEWNFGQSVKYNSFFRIYLFIIPFITVWSP